MSNGLARVVICVFCAVAVALVAVLALISDYPWITVPAGVVIAAYMGRQLVKDLRKLGGQ